MGEPAYEHEFPAYQPPVTPDFSYDDGQKVNSYTAGDEVFAQPPGFDDFPAFPVPTFPNLEPIFDEGAFESFDSSASQYNSPSAISYSEPTKPAPTYSQPEPSYEAPAPQPSYSSSAETLPM